MDEQGLGKQLQVARQRAGLTQQELCHKANLSFSTLTKIERGAIKAPSIFTVQAIAVALNTGLDELMGHNTPANKRDLKRTKSGASFIYFDMNGCLVHFFQRAFNKLAQDTGNPLDTVESAFWHFNDQVCRGTMSINDFNKSMAERLHVNNIDWTDYYLSTVEPIEPMRGVLEWAVEHYRIGLLTNTMPGLVSALRKRGQLPNVPYDVIIDSSEVGAIKPESAIYEIAAQRAGCDTEEILLIDDSRANLMAAERLGWHVLWFDDSHPEESTDRVRQTLEPANEDAKVNA